MSQKDSLLYPMTIAEYIEKIFMYSNKIDSADDFLWVNDQMNFNASTNLLIAIGEDSKKIDSKLKERFPEFRWKDIAGMSNILAHDYRGIDPEMVFSVIKEYLDDLKTVIIGLIEIVDPDKSRVKEFLDSPHYIHIKFLLKV